MIFRLATSTIINSLKNFLFIKTGIDYTSPVHVYAQVNSQCNSKCQMCSEWRIKNVELPASIWIKALKELKTISKNVKVSFAGGESLLKKDLFEIFEFCYKHKIMYGLTTNGILLNKQKIEKLIDLKPFIINVSLDAVDRKIYKEIRCVDRLEKVKENIEYLNYYKEKVGSKTILSLKSVVSKENLHHLDKIAEYAKELNLVGGVTFQPIIDITPECGEMMDVDKSDLTTMIDKLILMKKKGFNIMNSESNMLSWIQHFDKKLTFRKKQCIVPLRNLYIVTNGNIQLCDLIYESLGNIKHDNISEVLKKIETKKLKKDLVNCDKNCTYLVQRSFKDYVYLTFKYLNQ